MKGQIAANQIQSPLPCSQSLSLTALDLPRLSSVSPVGTSDKNQYVTTKKTLSLK